ncbi:ABC transporter ATP-binding protein [Corynebacterium cystitidis]|uniref:ABC-2 type transport system ATP-binding protein n=1 Tax=Corynebacterium cystitidis DSM 20524 TaxID=1121357 RepID=A0A1H9VK01_9CORY|nr:ATP-binding cassette domain-containing protein [Corynebacterium cystitidis]WJY81435.1 putative ABC transporter ATP-binding protein YxlF [Corynebacterium cystitidis DSM 20524]SES21831.1 ABC-2 type transport system ATP-binding protein [Corynebacterium cystitidis DSM 20524]SNV87446.1 ABC transporter ATP-binding protein [Corynebacterium cystitidis]
MSISCSGITVSFGHHTVLDSVDLVARPGRVHALLGRNGAGKSTLMSVMLGLITPDRGTVELGGQPLSRAALRNVGASVNGPAYYGHLSARDNLRVYTALLGLPDSEADRVLALVGFEEAGRKKARSFSTGMKARLALAQALLGEPKILLLDEPQNGLDPQGIADLRRFLRQRAAAGSTVLVSSHQLGEVTHLADDATIIADGHITYSGTLQQLAAAGSLEEEFFRLTAGAAHNAAPNAAPNQQGA